MNAPAIREFERADARTHPPDLSICIPTYNRADILRATLEHLASLESLRLEVVVSDNASPDHTADVVTAFGDRFVRLRYLRHARNAGAAMNCDVAQRLATSKYVYLLCDDDRVIPDGLAAAVRTLTLNPDVVAVYGGYEEWDPVKDQILAVQSQVAQPMRFSRTDKARLYDTIELLWCPVARREVLQRFCFHDDNSFGYWRLVSQFLDHGEIEVIPDRIYRHAQTVPRMEYELTEHWYHDSHRADMEMFQFNLGVRNAEQVGAAIGSRVGKAFKQGFRFAKMKNDFARQHFFLQRASAYGVIPETALVSWERSSLVELVAVHLANRVRSLPEIEVVMIEACATGERLRAELERQLPDATVAEIELTALLDQDFGPATFMVMMDWSSLVAREGRFPACPERQAAVLDLASTLRITSQPLSELGF